MKASAFLTVFNQPEQSILPRCNRDWEVVINQARSANLLSRLEYKLRAAGLLQQVPEAPRNHLLSARKQAEAQHRQVRWEIQRVGDALSGMGAAPVLLKGGAYIYADAPPAQGRTLNDIDILVPKKLLPEVEKRLMVEGYITTKVNDYDIKYYREWSHEIPPLQHYKRGITLDVHHNILPTLRQPLNPEKLLSKARISDEGIGVLQLHDMLIHSATHLFMEGEFDSALRDLSDMVLLFDQVEAEQSWQELTTRAVELGLGLPLFYAYHYSQPLFQRDYQQDQAFRVIKKPRLQKCMDLVFTEVLIPHHASCQGPGFKAAALLLYMRGHYLRMPLKMLLPHLLRKALRPASQHKQSSAV